MESESDIVIHQGVSPKKALPSNPSGVILEEGEHIVLMKRQHWLVFRKPTYIMIMIPLLFVLVTVLIDVITLPDVVRNIVGQFSIYGAIGGFIVGGGWFIWRFYLWWKTIYYLTNKRLVLLTQNGLFSHDDRETSLNMIQDVRAQVEGLQATLYKYGDVSVQVSGEDSQLTMFKVAQPREVAHAIIREAHLR